MRNLLKKYIEEKNMKYIINMLKKIQYNINNKYEMGILIKYVKELTLNALAKKINVGFSILYRYRERELM